ncbi:MAG: exosortase system-associated protein, TIGR04073 family [Candidatus Omnitrophica bacterium]|nr:exosortase system-associated protein, TIGR04073 family [Candidatus Omnitrophota bacterium]
MMNYLKIIVLALVLCLSISSITYAYGPMDKLGRGVANVLTSTFEVPERMGRETDENGIFAGSTVGLFKGVVETVKRLVVGEYETATFYAPVPCGYKPILTDPEFFMDRFNKT